jgi:hypothetical protein
VDERHRVRLDRRRHILDCFQTALKARFGTEFGPPDGVIGRPARGELAELVAALQADDWPRTACAASNIRGEAQPWNIMQDWMCR